MFGFRAHLLTVNELRRNAPSYLAYSWPIYLCCFVVWSIVQLKLIYLGNMYVCMYICMYVRMSVCMCVSIFCLTASTSSETTVG